MQTSSKSSNDSGTSKVNVLVFCGPGVSPSCLLHLKTALRSLLLTRYDILSISAESLIREPWTSSCALLAFPGGRDLGYLSSLGETGCKRIADWVHNEGGRYLGLCAGAYFACDRIDFESGREGFEIIGERPLKLFPGMCKGTAFPGFVYGSEEGARDAIVSLESDAWENVGHSGPQKLDIYYNGGGSFEELPHTEGRVSIIARYDELIGRPAAGVLCQVGQNGKAVLWGVHPEHPTTLDATNLSGNREAPHNALLRSTLRLLDLQVPQTACDIVAATPLFLASSDYKWVPNLALEIASRFPNSHSSILPDLLNTFLLHPQSQTSRVFALARSVEQRGIDIILCSDSCPSANATPLFDLNHFLRGLAQNRKRLEIPVKASLGSYILYGEVVTSTQTILDKNPHFLSALPSGFVFVGSHQTAGRGRGSNSWLSPPGCLQFSLVLRVPKAIGAKLVFVQYLFGLSVVEAVRGLAGYEDLQLRLKWPNDLYADLGEEGGLNKIGGILVNSMFAGEDFTVIIGCGINTTNSTPTTSVLDLIRHHNKINNSQLPIITQEELLASILPRFESMWMQFESQGDFSPFADLYTRRWLHSAAEVTIQETGTTVRIIGLAPENGYLRTIIAEPPQTPPGPQYIDLQPDGNSFDMMQGLLKTKG